MQFDTGQFVDGDPKVAGLPMGFHFHDLRHTGNHLVA